MKGLLSALIAVLGTSSLFAQTLPFDLFGLYTECGGVAVGDNDGDRDLISVAHAGWAGKTYSPNLVYVFRNRGAANNYTFANVTSQCSLALDSTTSTQTTMVDARGNTWTYDASGNSFGYNQSVDANGSFDNYGSGNQAILSDPNGVNYNAASHQPYARPIQSNWTAQHPNNPWNVSTGATSSGSNPYTPSIRVKNTQ